MKEYNWLLLTYKVPSEPSKNRVALWRRLKALGAVYLQNGVCLLPKTEEHNRQLKMIEHEIDQMKGESVLLETIALDKLQQQKVIERFKTDRNDEYQELLGRCADFEKEIIEEIEKQHFSYAELEENDVDLKKLQSWFEKIKKLDFYDAPLSETAAEKLQMCHAMLEDFAQKVFNAQNENSL